VTTRDGDVVVLVMPGVSVAYLAVVHRDGEQLDTIKERLLVTQRSRALADAQVMIKATGGRILRWMNGASEPERWPDA
jgi:hypothetical protein